MAAAPGPTATADPRSAPPTTATGGVPRTTVARARRTRLWALAEVRWATASTVLFGLGIAAEFGGAPTWLYWTLYLACYAAGGWEPGWAGIQALREKSLDVVDFFRLQEVRHQRLPSVKAPSTTAPTTAGSWAPTAAARTSKPSGPSRNLPTSSRSGLSPAGRPGPTTGCRRQPSGVDVKGNLWEVHHDPYDLSHVWVRDTRAGGWITVPWTRLGTVSAPFADFTWRHARSLLAARGADTTDEGAIAAAVEDLLTRAGAGPDRRIAARTRAALTRLPEVLRANRRHQRIVRRGTHPSTALAYVDARDRLTKWFTNEVGSTPLQQRWNRRLNLLGEDPFGDPHRPSASRIELVTYPEAVVLTRLFASPHWRGHSRLPAEAAQRLAIAPDQLPLSTSP